MREKKFWIQFLVLVALIFVTRFWKLGEIPIHLTQDEVAVGYSAYSILSTGMDEWGEKYPLQFRSIGDYKQPVLVYLVVMSERLLGLSEWAVRMPVAVFSAMSVLLLWWMARNLIFKTGDSWWAFGVGVVMALSPWHIRPSRMSHDAVIALFFVLLNLCFWTLFVKRWRFRYFLGVVLSGLLAIASYHSTKLFIPLFGVLMIGIFRKETFVWIRKGMRRREWCLGMLVISMLSVWVLWSFVLGRGATRGAMTFISKDFEYDRVLRSFVLGDPFAWFWEKVLLFGFWFKRYVEYLSLSFYISDGLELTHKNQPGQGVLLGLEFLALVVGLLVVLAGRAKDWFREKWMGVVLVIYLLVGYLPASLANNSLHPYRTGLVIPVVCILIVVGWKMVWEWGRKKGFLWTIVGVIILSYVVGVGRFVDNYLIHYPVELSEYRQYPWGDVAKYVNEIRGGYEKVIVDPRFGTQGPYTTGVPQYYFLFYGQYDPAKYQSRKMWGWDTYDYENFEFRGVEWQKEDKKGVLYVASPWSFMTREGVKEKQILKKFEFVNGIEGIWVVEGFEK